MEEHVLVVPTSVFQALGIFQGFCQQVDRYLPVLLDPQNTDYRPRSLMEQDPRFKQLIPYVVFRHRSPDDGQWWYFRYTRGTGQGEVRLHAKRSIGVGGHISLMDADQPQPYWAGMRRELEEEVDVEIQPTDGAPRASLSAGMGPSEVTGHSWEAASGPDSSAGWGRIVGLINDDSNEVGQVHLGVVHLVDVARPVVLPREADLLDAGFVSPPELAAGLDEFETWSQIALQHLLQLPAAGRVGSAAP